MSKYRYDKALVRALGPKASSHNHQRLSRRRRAVLPVSLHYTNRRSGQQSRLQCTGLSGRLAPRSAATPCPETAPLNVVNEKGDQDPYH